MAFGFSFAHVVVRMELRLVLKKKKIVTTSGGIL